MKRSRLSSTAIPRLLVLTILAGSAGAKQSPPGKTWEKTDLPENLGYSSRKLEDARAFANTLKTAAVVIVVDGVILYEWGETSREFMTHSVRKSFMSALYGNYIENETIPMDATIEELGIDDSPSLTEAEKQATVRDLLKARSGIYHTALYESSGMKALKPARHTQRAGTHWYYNNWDFNALCTIFENLTGKKFFEALEADIAGPIQMEDFDPEDGWYVTGEESVHPAYPFKITARDMARFGLLMLRKGKWGDRQVIPEDWVEESTRYHSDAALYGYDGYGYMWWVVRDHNKFPHLPNVRLKEGAFSARGSGGHFIIVIPDRNMVFVHRVDTWERGNSVASEHVGTLLQMILDAKIE